MSLQLITTPTIIFSNGTHISPLANTATHGWVSEPSGRGTWSILWSCLSTIFLCTWSCLFLDVPSRYTRQYMFLRKMKYLVFIVVFPEYTLIWAIQDLCLATKLLKEIKRHSHESWNMVHAQFLQMSGFVFEFGNGKGGTDEPERYRWKDDNGEFLHRLVSGGRLTEVPISSEELQSRSKSDFLVKVLAILQVGWLLLQTLCRAIEHLDITALEILTVTFSFTAIGIYAVSWDKPQDVSHPFVVRRCDEPKEWEVNLTKPVISAVFQNFQSYDAYKVPVRRGLEGFQYSVLSAVAGCAFGSLHCLAWRSPYPTIT